jgi:hypothetical protein
MNDDDIIKLIIENNKIIINFDEIESNINEECIIESIRMLKYLKNKQLLQIPSSTVYNVYLYIDDNNFKWIFKYLKGNYVIYKYTR